jgi:hypothetical protein
MFGRLNDLCRSSKRFAVKAGEASLGREEPEALAIRENNPDCDVTDLDDARFGHGKPLLFAGSHR